jgi:hypothetical protein
MGDGDPEAEVAGDNWGRAVEVVAQQAADISREHALAGEQGYDGLSDRLRETPQRTCTSSLMLAMLDRLTPRDNIFRINDPTRR